MITEEEYHSHKETYKFLCHLIDPQKVPRIPLELRNIARKCLEHYPERKKLESLGITIDFFNPR